MKNKAFTRCWLLSCLGVLIASYYPLYMGVRVISDMIANGSVLKENYPKYIIPYTPISIAIIVGVLLMPLLIKFCKRFAFVGGGFLATALFFAVELLFEQKVVVSTAETVTKLEDWQMFMCYVPPEGLGETVITYKTQTAVDILMGDYNPAFKLHFYIISILLIITVLNCIYGFGQIIKNGEKKRLVALILQSACSLTFLGLCILACFTAFWRDGSIQVSPLSASLMTVFFVLLGVTFGVFTGSFLLGKRKMISVLIPSIVASAMTLLMYIGEMILLNGHLYSMGAGVMFDGLPEIVFAPIDLLIILLSGCITAWIFTLLNRNNRSKKRVILFSIICAVLVLVIVAALLFSGDHKDNNADSLERSDGTVQLSSKTSDLVESRYEVSAYLSGTDFSSVSQSLKDRITQEWDTYKSMTDIQRYASSKIWGMVYSQVDLWEECEKEIGVEVLNPLESLTWLNKTGYYGMESVDPSETIKHIQVTANTTLTLGKSVDDVHIDAGYNVDNLRITLSATLKSGAGTHTTGSVTNGYATYDEDTVVTGSGIPVLIVTTDEMNNNGYYHGDYFDPTAYWVKDNVFYTLRVIGDEAEKENIQSILDQILANI